MPKIPAPVLTITFPRPLPEMSSRDLLGAFSDLSQAVALLDGGALHHEVLAQVAQVEGEILRRLEGTTRVRCQSCGWEGGCQECSSGVLVSVAPGTLPGSAQLTLPPPVVVEDEPVVVEGEEDDLAGVGCPGCGCFPGDGRTPGCHHPEGCGYLESEIPETDADPEGADGKMSLPDALRRLAAYLSPAHLPENIRQALFFPDPEDEDYGAAGRELVLDRLVDDLDLYYHGGLEDGLVAHVAVVLHGIMGGKEPHEVLADQGLLDG